MLLRMESTPIVATCSENSWCKTSSHKSAGTVAETELFQNAKYVEQCGEKARKCEDAWNTTFWLFGSESHEKYPPLAIILHALRDMHRDKNRGDGTLK